MGVAGGVLMEEAGRATAMAALALLHETERAASAPLLILAGPGNNGGDGHVAARLLGLAGRRVVLALLSSQPLPVADDAARAWEELDGISGVERTHAPSAQTVRLMGTGIERAALVVDALLGTGARGRLREPIRSGVMLCLLARRAGVPILSVDTPTSVDLTSGMPSDPVVQAHLTITFHRPKTGLQTRAGQALAGRVLVAPIGIPPGADLL